MIRSVIAALMRLNVRLSDVIVRRAQRRGDPVDIDEARRLQRTLQEILDALGK